MAIPPWETPAYAEDIAGLGDATPQWSPPPWEPPVPPPIVPFSGDVAGAPLPPWAQQMPEAAPVVPADDGYEFTLAETEAPPPPEGYEFSLAETQAPFAETPPPQAPPPQPPPPPAEDPGLATPSLDMSPEEFAANSAARNWELQQEQARQQIEARAANEKKVANEAARFEEVQFDANQRMAAISQDITELSKQRVDPGRYFKNQSLGGNIASAIAATIGGYLSAYRNGRNTAIDQLMQSIDQDIEAQKFDLTSQRQGLEQQSGLVGELYRQNGDLHRSTTVAQQMMYQSVIDGIGDKIAMVDPRGTKAQAMVGAVQKIRGAQASAMQQAQADAYKAAQENRKQSEVERTNLAREDNTRRTRWADMKKHKDQMAMQKEVATASREQDVTKELRDVTMHGLKTPDGQPIIANNKTDADALKKQVMDTGKATILIKQINGMMDKLGGELSLGATADGRKVRALHRKLFLAMVAINNLGVIAADDAKFVEDEIGKDPGSYIAPPKAQMTAMMKAMQTDVALAVKVQARGQTLDMKSLESLYDVAIPEFIPDDVAEDEAPDISFDEGRLREEGITSLAREKGVPVDEITKGVAPQWATGLATPPGYYPFEQELGDTVKKLKYQAKTSATDRKAAEPQSASILSTATKNRMLEIDKYIDDHAMTGVQSKQVDKAMAEAGVDTMEDLMHIVKTGQRPVKAKPKAKRPPWDPDDLSDLPYRPRTK